MTSESPSFPKANVPRYPMTIVPAAPDNPERSEADGLGEVGERWEVTGNENRFDNFGCGFI